MTTETVAHSLQLHVCPVFTLKPSSNFTFSRIRRKTAFLPSKGRYRAVLAIKIDDYPLYSIRLLWPDPNPQTPAEGSSQSCFP